MGTRLSMGRYFIPTSRDLQGSDLYHRGPHFGGKTEAQSYAEGVRAKGDRARVTPDADGFTVWEAKGKTGPDFSRGPGMAKAVSGYGGEIFALIKDGKIVGSSTFTGPRKEHEKSLRRNGYRIGKGTVPDAEYLGQTSKAKRTKRPRLSR